MLGTYHTLLNFIYYSHSLGWKLYFDFVDEETDVEGR